MAPRNSPPRARIAFSDSAAKQLEKHHQRGGDPRPGPRPGRRLRRPRGWRGPSRRHRRPPAAPVHRRHRTGPAPVLGHSTAHRGRRRLRRGLTRQEHDAVDRPRLSGRLDRDAQGRGVPGHHCAPRRPGHRARAGRVLARVCPRTLWTSTADPDPRTTRPPAPRRAAPCSTTAPARTARGPVAHAPAGVDPAAHGGTCEASAVGARLGRMDSDEELLRGRSTERTATTRTWAPGPAAPTPNSSAARSTDCCSTSPAGRQTRYRPAPRW